MKTVFKIFSIYLILFISSCGLDLEDFNKDNELDEKHTEYWSEKINQKWKDLCKFLKIDLSDEEEKKLNSIPESLDEEESFKEKLNLLEKNLQKTTRFLIKDKTTGFKDYEEILDKVAPELLEKQKVSQCRSIKKFYKPDDDIFTKQARLSGFNSSIWVLKYELNDGIIRHGLISIPSKGNTGKKSVILYSHGGDNGLSYKSQIRENLGDLQNEYIILAPSFSGEPICKGKPSRDLEDLNCNAEGVLIKPIGENIPWSSDITDSEGMLNCFTEALYEPLETDNSIYSSVYENIMKPHLKDLKRTEVIEKLRAEISKCGGLKRIVNNNLPNPETWLFGTSRGGLVSALLAAQSGLYWQETMKQIFLRDEVVLEGKKTKDKDKDNYKSSQKEKNNTSSCFDFIRNFYKKTKEFLLAKVKDTLLLDEKRNTWFSSFLDRMSGKSYILNKFKKTREFKAVENIFKSRKENDLTTIMPPTYSGIVTIAAPLSVSFGRVRLLIEQLVKGNSDISVVKRLPGLKKLTHLFDEYRHNETTKESIAKAGLEILKRDATLMAPFIIAALRDWHQPYDQNGTWNKQGKWLFIHHKEDRIVPYEQSQAAFNILTFMSNLSEIKRKTNNPGLKLSFRTFNSKNIKACDNPNDYNQHAVIFHFDPAFYDSKASFNKELVNSGVRNIWLKNKENMTRVKKTISRINSLYNSFIDLPTINEKVYKDLSEFGTTKIPSDIKSFLINIIDYEISGMIHSNEKIELDDLQASPNLEYPKETPMQVVRNWFKN